MARGRNNCENRSMHYIFVLIATWLPSLLCSPRMPPIPDDFSSTNDVTVPMQAEGSNWELLPPPRPDWSHGFRNTAINYTCSPVSCSSHPRVMRESLFHFIAGVEHRSNFPLMVYRVCEAFQWCIPPSSGFKISIHYEGHAEPKMFRPVLRFFQSLRISPDQWVGPGASFSANNKMVRYLDKMHNVSNFSRLIYHVDLDEFPDVIKMRAAALEIERGECDAIRGYWCDRVSAQGTMNSVKLSGTNNLQEQFPLRCNFSINYMPERTTLKILAYR